MSPHCSAPALWHGPAELRSSCRSRVRALLAQGRGRDLSHPQGEPPGLCPAQSHALLFPSTLPLRQSFILKTSQPIAASACGPRRGSLGLRISAGSVKGPTGTRFCLEGLGPSSSPRALPAAPCGGFVIAVPGCWVRRGLGPAPRSAPLSAQRDPCGKEARDLFPHCC